MKQTTVPVRFEGRGRAGALTWSATLGDQQLLIRQAASDETVPLEFVHEVQIERSGFFSRRLRISTGRTEVCLDGLRRRAARTFRGTLTEAVAERREQLRVEALERWLIGFLDEVDAWQQDVEVARERELEKVGWLRDAFADCWTAHRPQEPVPGLLADPVVRERLTTISSERLRALALWRSGVRVELEAWNEQYLRREMRIRRRFFDTIERLPLTDEQIRAVVCFADRVQVIASAGSGKTSTMVAKAGYAVARGLVSPERILLLAFNREAAAELRQRIGDRFSAAGLDPTGIVATTFHAFGLRVLGKATGRKPSVAPWVESDDLGHLSRIITSLKEEDPLFHRDWDLYRLVFSRELPDFGREEDEPEDWDARTRRSGFRTLQGEVVRSRGERMIADWLFYNGVEYEYERPYEIDVADEDHRQYTPDFFYPAIGTYHEHWAFDRAGRSPESFTDYETGAAWKRDLHRTTGTSLIETTMAQLWDGSAFAHLAKELESRGVQLQPDPLRPAAGAPAIDDERLTRTLHTFLAHVKSNRLSDEQLRDRLLSDRRPQLRRRHELFLRLFASVRKRWDQDLRQGGYVDFEDMLGMAADVLENGSWQSPFDLVLVDEMQDASASRARLVHALGGRDGVRICAVGDDWQSINRFAGADMSVMTRFADLFGRSTVLRLERTFRSPQSICDVAGGFVRRNPHQLVKRVVSSVHEAEPSVRIIATGDAREQADVLAQLLGEIPGEVRTGSGRPTVFILGRYRRDETLLPSDVHRRWPGLDIRFTTIHGSKGLEADYVVVPGMVQRAFPSAVQDDAVLHLAMPAAEGFPFAEERRLLYVALTRARRQVNLLTVKGKESPFITEIAKDFGIPVIDRHGKPSPPPVPCPSCGEGFLVERRSGTRRFLGCSRFPKCRQTANLQPPLVRSSAVSSARAVKNSGR